MFMVGCCRYNTSLSWNENYSGFTLKAFGHNKKYLQVEQFEEVLLF